MLISFAFLLMIRNVEDKDLSKFYPKIKKFGFIVTEITVHNQFNIIFLNLNDIPGCVLVE